MFMKKYSVTSSLLILDCYDKISKKIHRFIPRGFSKHSYPKKYEPTNCLVFSLNVF